MQMKPKRELPIAFRRGVWAAILLALVMPAFAFAQTDPAKAAPPKPWDRLIRDPATRVKMDFRNTNVDAIILAFERFSGITILKDPALVGRMSLFSPSPTSVPDAFDIFAAALDLNGCNIVRVD